MERSDFREAVQVTRPTRTVVLMAVFLAFVVAVAFFLSQPIYTVFLANPYLNGLILCVLIVGIGYTFWQVNRLNRCVDWMEAFIAERPGFDTIPPPRLVKSMAGMLRDRESRRRLSPSVVRAILDSIATRLDEARDITRYAANLLIFLGLLGTFWGLSITIPAVVETIRELAPGADENASDVFGRLIGNLGEQMRGLGTAFASSLLGLAGSLILGFLEILAGHAQNRFYRELEEALSQITRIAGDGEAGSEFAAAMEQSFEGIQQLTDQLAHSGQSLLAANDHMEASATVLGDVAHVLSADEAHMTRLIDSQEAMRVTLAEATARNRGVIGGMDEGTRNRIASIDGHLLRIADELAAGRAQSTSEIKGELRNLSAAIEALVDPRAGRR